METTTPFDLNQAILKWRDGLAQSPAIRGENLDELEVHLRDSVATLRARDLSADEAFLIATKRVGNGAVLGKEFGKVNAANVWVERCLWVLIAMQIFEGVSRFASVVGLFITQLASWIPTVFFPDCHGLKMGDLYRSVAFIVLPSFIIMLLLLLFWRLLNSPQSNLLEKIEALLCKPYNLAVGLLAFNLAIEIISGLTAKFIFADVVTPAWLWFRSFPLSLFYSVALFFLAQRR